MGEENLEDRLDDMHYLNSLWALDFVHQVLKKGEAYEAAECLLSTFMHVSNNYIDFRLKHYDSEGRKMIRETYKVLGYNPNSPKQLGSGK